MMQDKKKPASLYGTPALKTDFLVLYSAASATPLSV